MAHSICTSEASGKLACFQRLWRTLLTPDIDPRTRLERLFEHETAEFDLEYAFLSNIDLENQTERFEVAHGTHESLQPDTIVPLSETYCRKTIADPEGTLAISDAPAEGWGDDPAYETFGLRSYLGTTVSVDEELYGTLCFASTASREDPIVDEEKAIIEMHCRWVEYVLTVWDGASIRGPYTNTIQESAVSKAAIDSVMDALGTRTRREILLSLVGDADEVSLATLERRADGKNVRLRLHHVALPKLASAGYIEWNSDSGTVFKGPRFSQVEPLVRSLKEYHGGFTG